MQFLDNLIRLAAKQTIVDLELNFLTKKMAATAKLIVNLNLLLSLMIIFKFFFISFFFLFEQNNSNTNNMQTQQQQQQQNSALNQTSSTSTTNRFNNSNNSYEHQQQQQQQQQLKNQQQPQNMSPNRSNSNEMSAMAAQMRNMVNDKQLLVKLLKTTNLISKKFE